MLCKDFTISFKLLKTAALICEVMRIVVNVEYSNQHEFILSIAIGPINNDQLSKSSKLLIILYMLRYEISEWLL